MGLAKGRYENVGMKQTSCITSVASDGATSLTLNIANHRDAVEMGKTADDIPFDIYAFCLYPASYSACREHPYCGRARLHAVEFQYVVRCDDLIHI